MINKGKSFLLIFTLIGLISCKSSKVKDTPTAETGMFKVAILYPNGEEKNFDMDYYEKKHMPMLAGFLGNNLKFYEIDEGIAGGTPKDKAPFVTIGYFYCYDIAEYNKAIAQNIDAIINDIKNYTNIRPTIQISKIRRLRNNSTK